ncbi:Hypothetical predicted protein [Paramuricea clavata]|uniref:Uncharacterized protein n=1 Tax=Paramuricea clavata TaxID=317549 RepID=A0A7D9HZN7_PARCT|nr:Hypothetical predicted protein [Paramuricea clavata]
MGSQQQAPKRGVQNLNNSLSNTPSKSVRPKISKPNENKEGIKEEISPDVSSMFETIMSKLEVEDLKKDNEKLKKTDVETQKRLQSLEEQNTILNNRVIDLQARPMRDNLVFYNIEENEEENTTETLQSFLESRLGIENAKSIKIDRSHRMGRKQRGTKPQAIVAKFNYFPDRERVLSNAKKLKGTNLAVSEQFPEEIVKIRKWLFPEYKKARVEGRRAKLVKGQTLH